MQTPEDISTEWLSEILGEPVISFHISPVAVAGFGSVSVRVTATLEFSSRRLFAKFLLPEEVRGPMHAPFLHEVYFYTSIASLVRSLGSTIPDCVFAGVSAIVLDEVAGIVGDQLAGCSIERSCSILSLLARMHARFWKSELLSTEELHLMSIVLPSSDPSQSHAHFSAISNILNQGVNAYRSMLEGKDPVIPNSIPAAAFDALAAAAARGIDLLLAVAQRFNTLCHQDVRLDNIIFSPKYQINVTEDIKSVDGEDEDVILLDWQRYGKGWNMLDVAQYIVYNVHEKNCNTFTIEEVENRLLRVYIDTLMKSNGFVDAESCTIEKAVTDYKLAILFLCVMDLPTWSEQQQKHSVRCQDTSAIHSYLELFPSERMASLAPTISSNLAAAYLRNNCGDLLDSLSVLEFS